MKCRRLRKVMPSTHLGWAYEWYEGKPLSEDEYI